MNCEYSLSNVLALRAVDEDAVQLGQEVVSGRAVNGPAFRQTFARFENLFDHHVERADQDVIALGAGERLEAIDEQRLEAFPAERCGRCRRTAVSAGLRAVGCRSRGGDAGCRIGRWRGGVGGGKFLVEGLPADLEKAGLLQPAEIFGRIVQAVGVVDPQPLHVSLVHQLQDQAVRLVEDVDVLHADRGQLVDVEEPPIIDLVAGDPPIGQPIRLLGQKLVEQVEALRLAPRAVKERHVLLNELVDCRGRFGQLLQPPLDHFFFAAPLADLLDVGLGHAGQMADPREDALVFDEVRLVAGERLLERIDAIAENRRPRVGRDGQAPLVVVQPEASVLEGEHQLLLLEHLAELIAQNREQHLVGQVGLERVPVDVEKRGVGRTGTVFEHVGPPGICVADAHVIGHHVDNLPQPERLERFDEGVIVLLGADLRIEHVVIDDVVAVLGAGVGHHVGR